MTRNGITASNSTSQRQHMISFCFLQNTPFHKQNDVIAVAEMWNYLLLTHFCSFFRFIPPENTRRSKVFWYFQVV